MKEVIAEVVYLVDDKTTLRQALKTIREMTHVSVFSSIKEHGAKYDRVLKVKRCEKR